MIMDIPKAMDTHMASAAMTIRLLAMFIIGAMAIAIAIIVRIIPASQRSIVPQSAAGSTIQAAARASIVRPLEAASMVPVAAGGFTAVRELAAARAAGGRIYLPHGD